jgi:hypothetical protein
MMLWLTCTHGRYRCLQRNLKCYIDQQFTGKSVMFICNSGAPLKLPDNFSLPNNKEVYIDNCSMMNFQSVGEKYNHALTLALQLYPDIGIVNSANDDDIFLPNHLSEGWHGINRAYLQDMDAYKPKESYYRYRGTANELVITKAENTLEPSIFVDIDHLKRTMYAPVSVRYHQQWLDPLLHAGKLFIDPQGTSTLIYNWGDNSQDPGNWNIYKMSGSGEDNSNNFQAHKRNSQDIGTGVLYPNEDNSQYYKLT